MSYNDLIMQEGEYTYSANIQFDIENDNKLMRFIPNETTISLLSEYFVDIIRHKSNVHSRILYGSYGTGKSHFLTVLSILLNKRYTDGLAFSTFKKRIKGYDNELFNDIDSFVSNKAKKPYLVVPIVFDFGDFERCIFFSLKKALEKEHIDITFKTFYTQALLLIQQWKSSNESLERLVYACKESKTTVEQLENKLNIFDKNSENVFKNVFKNVTFGVDYIYEALNMVDTLNEVNEVIIKNYSGIVFIFDEFGRYMEDNINSIHVKSVQDIAEYCDHGNYDNHIILVSHKEIGQYTKEYGRKIVNEWKKVQGRYKATPINDKQDQCLSLIKNILTKKPDLWEAFKEKFMCELETIYSEAWDFKGFLVKATDNPFENGFPLHPISLYALDKLSKKIAQNERTFFTYLASKEENSLYKFLVNHDENTFHFVGIDNIYDYFEQNIKSIQSDSSYEWYKNLQIALGKGNYSSNDTNLEVKVLKVIATINIINDFSTLVADEKTIISVIDSGLNKQSVVDAINQLTIKKIIKYNGVYDRYEFFDASIFDVEKMIVSESENINDAMVCKTLNIEFLNFVLYPYGYNEMYKINRVFIPTFTTIDELGKKSFYNQLTEFYDGVLAFVFADKNTEDNEVAISTVESPRLIAVANYNCEKIYYEVKKFISIQYLESQQEKYAKEDPSIINEIAYYKTLQRKVVIDLVDQWKNLKLESFYIAAEGNGHNDITTYNGLSDLASNILEESYSKTLIVNNELINKNVLSGSMTSAKKNAIRAIYKGELANDYYGLTMLSPEYICVRSLLSKNGLYNSNEEIDQNILPDNSLPQVAVAEKINEYIEKFKKATFEFDKFYQELKMPPFGLRDGYLSLLVAYMLLPYKKNLVISSHDVEQEITVDLFEEMIKRPYDYKISIVNWSKAQQNYIDDIEKLFLSYIDINAINKNRLKAIYEGMFLHYKNLSKAARTTSIYVSENVKNYRKIMEKSHTNYNNFFFKHLRSLSGEYFSLIELINSIVNELEGVPNKLSNDIKKCILSDISMVNANDSLCKSLILTYQKDWSKKKHRSFDFYTNSWLDYISKLTEDTPDETVLMELSKLLTGFELTFWSDITIEEFKCRLVDIVNKLKDYKSTETLENNETKMTITNSEGIKKSVVFGVDELSTLSKTMKNKVNSVFSNFGASVSYEDKLQVLLSLLDDYIEGK